MELVDWDIFYYFQQGLVSSHFLDKIDDLPLSYVGSFSAYKIKNRKALQENIIRCIDDRSISSIQFAFDDMWRYQIYANNLITISDTLRKEIAEDMAYIGADEKRLVFLFSDDEEVFVPLHYEISK